MSIGDPLKRVLKRFFPRQYIYLRGLHRYARKSRKLLDDPKETPMGFKLSGNDLMASGLFEQEETAIVFRILQKVDSFINIGANIGYYCCIALQSGKKVIAFEPLEDNLRFLYRNIAANNWEDRIEIFPLAVSDQAGIVRLFGGGTGASLIPGWAGHSDENSTFVPATTLDTIFGHRLSHERRFILADVEGGEYRMLKGATNLLTQTPKPIWQLEICISAHQPRGISVNPNLLNTFRFFWDNGYEAWTADRTLRQITQAEIKRIARGGPDTVKTHNFLFIEAQEKYRILDA
jgi:FkbM family methyltransferase